ncbi:MAG TPA: DUF397 domain-containing protein [Pseudonocardiaceae bacterium]|nr:DUF397 domain-containing protein [Pseudonocardiaceae bacterium]
MIATPIERPRWRTSSHSGQNNNCVELAVHSGGAGIRDTKNRAGGTLAFGPAAWSVFLTSTKS